MGCRDGGEQKLRIVDSCGRVAACEWVFATTDLLRGSVFFGLLGSKLRFGFASLAWSCPRYAISDGGLTAIGAIGGEWGCPWGCLKKLAVSFWDDAS